MEGLLESGWLIMEYFRWIFFAQMLVSVDFPIEMPVGDISHVIRGASERKKVKEQFSA